MTTDSAALWQAFRRERTDLAFASIVERHVDLVYATAIRQTGDAEAAKDIAQAVFLDLHRKAGSLAVDLFLPGWLYRATTFAAAKSIRSDQRRRFRETEAMRQHQLHADGSDDGDLTEGLLPLLDEALNRLPEPDRQALILRFLDRQDLKSVGRVFGISDDAARKRVDRALERLREVLQEFGHSAAMPMLAVALGVLAQTTSPPTLAGSITAALAGSAGAATTVATTFSPVAWVGGVRWSHSWFRRSIWNGRRPICGVS